MIELVAGYNAFRWTDPTVSIPTLSWVSLIRKVYTRNYVTGIGFISYDPSELYPTMSILAQDTDYLVDMKEPYSLAGATLAASSAFSAFPGYVPVVTDAAPTTTVSPAFITTSAVAVSPIRIGHLVARMATGVTHYSALNPDHRQRLLGVALSSALPAEILQVQQRGPVRIAGLGLGVSGDVLFAGDDGALVANSSSGMAFHHIIGRTLSADSFLLNPQSTYSL